MLLDTCVISEVAKRRPAPHVVDWFERTSDSDLFLSVLTIGEIAKGCTKVDDVLRKGRLEAWLASLRVEFSERILAIDERTADTWGRISGDAEIKGTPIPTIDGLLAATAIRHGLTVVTRNTQHFACVGARVFNPWENVSP